MIIFSAPDNQKFSFFRSEYYYSDYKRRYFFFFSISSHMISISDQEKNFL